MDKKIWILFSVVFVDLLGFGILIPIFPLLVESYGGNAFMVGMLVAACSLFQFIFSPILGRLSDKYGRKPVLVISSLINAASYITIFLSPNIWVLLLSRIFGGIGSSNISVVQAYIADTTESHERTRVMSLFGAVFGLGFIFGPFLGGFLSSTISIHAPFFLTALFSLASSLLIFIFVAESNNLLQKHVKIELFNLKVTRDVLKPRNMAFLIFLFFLVNFALALVFGIFPLYSGKVLSWGEMQNGYYFTLIGIVSFVVQSFGIRLLLRKMGEPKIIRYGLISLGAAYLLFGMFNTVFLILLAGLLLATGFSLLNPSIQSLISLESKKNEQGIVMGISQSFASLARVLGPLIGGALATYRINYPYLFGFIVTVITFIWGRKYLRLYKRK